VVELDDEGGVKRRRRVDSPWGLALLKGSPERILVAAGPPRRSELVVMRTGDLTIEDRIQLGPRCLDAREVVVLDERAVVTCAAMPGVVVVDLMNGEILADLRMVPPQGEAFAHFEQPRNPLVVPGKVFSADLFAREPDEI
jgi:hypothetical protein